MQVMPENHLNSVVATTSGLCGGLGKALTAHLVITNITFQGIIEVAFYAAISALVGYGVKKGIDNLVNRFKKPKK
jgi:hypothetical protein